LALSPGLSADEAPPQIQWAASYGVALKQARELDRPVLVCFNMDGEWANNHAVQEIYRDPDFVALCDLFICVMGSKDRHEQLVQETPEGTHRVCSRFGHLSCDEHQHCEIKARQALIGKEVNIAPQHILLSPSGRVVERRAFHIGKEDLMKLMRRVAGIQQSVDVAEQKRKIQEALQKAEKKTYSFEKQEFVREIQELESSEAQEALLKYLGSGKDDGLKVAILQAISRSGDYTILGALTKSTKDSSSYVALAAVDSLGRLRLPGAAKSLKKLLGRFPKGHDHGRVLRAYAACGAGDKDALKYILKKAKSGDNTIRAHALVALHRFDMTEDIRKVVRSALQDDTNLMQASGAYAASMSHDETFREDLQEVVSNTDNRQLRELLLASLNHLDHKEEAGLGDTCGLEYRLSPFLPLGETRRF
jgi:hypothetical protein